MTFLGFKNRREGVRGVCGDKRLWIVVAVVFLLGVLILSSSKKEETKAEDGFRKGFPI